MSSSLSAVTLALTSSEPGAQLRKPVLDHHDLVARGVGRVDDEETLPVGSDVEDSFGHAVEVDRSLEQELGRFRIEGTVRRDRIPNRHHAPAILDVEDLALGGRPDGGEAPFSPEIFRRRPSVG